MGVHDPIDPIHSYFQKSSQSSPVRRRGPPVEIAEALVGWSWSTALGALTKPTSGGPSRAQGCLVVHPTDRQWVITLVINGISGASPLIITRVITYLLSGMNHQVWAAVGKLTGDGWQVEIWFYISVTWVFATKFSWRTKVVGSGHGIFKFVRSIFTTDRGPPHLPIAYKRIVFFPGYCVWPCLSFCLAHVQFPLQGEQDKHHPIRTPFQTWEAIQETANEGFQSHRGSPSFHPFIDGIFPINHPAMEVPPFLETLIFTNY